MNPRDFLLDQFHGMVLQATVQRARVYAPSAAERLREEFRRGLRSHLDDITARYERPVSEDEHLGNVVALADSVSRKHHAALRSGRFRIGPSQKALNLLLKYQWSAGWILEPPHCPFDRIIIDQLPARVRCNWTDLDSPEAYRGLVAAAREEAGALSLARWELGAYDKASPTARRALTV